MANVYGRHNVPDELVTILQKLSVNELLDFSLGSDGRWYVKCRQKELSPYLWMDLGQGSGIKLDRLTLGPDAEHWGVHKAADGSFQHFSSVGTRDAFTQEFDSKVQNIQTNNQIWFVSLGFKGNWAFSVKGFVRHRCGKPFHTELTGGWKAQKRVSTIVLSPMARVWIIVWEDGTLSHNLPSNIATDVEDYCQLQHSLKASSNGPPNSGRPNPRKGRNPRNNQPGAGPSAQKQQSTTNSTQPSSAQQTTNNPSNVTSAPVVPLPAPPPTLPTVNPIVTSTSTYRPAAQRATTQPATSSVHVPKAPPPMGRSTTQPTSPTPLTKQNLESFSSTFSQSNCRARRSEEMSIDVYVPPKKLTTTLRLLNSAAWSDKLEYEKIVDLFEDGWKHPEKARAMIKRIFVVSLPDHLNESYQEYKDMLERQNGWTGANEQLVFHGTSRECSLGEEAYRSTLCESTTCTLCCILRNSFLVSKSGSAGRTFKRFGPGIYTSSVSSKADDYTKSPWFSDDRVIIVARVALGKSSIQYQTTQHLTEPPIGYDSVLGEVGIHLNYNEQVLYKDEAIRPAYIVVYERAPAAAPPAPPAPAPRPAPTTWSNPAPTRTTNSSSSGCTIM
ncbi:hypothetical protein FS837_008389 [Tulasnella sp. UAMH 9824]|nr:hypothetical protein FS837_008389 [Tulasnella sp. UAMH 9824]